MQPDPYLGWLVTMLFLLVGMMMLLGTKGIFSRFLRGFCRAVFRRLIRGGRGSPGNLYSRRVRSPRGRRP
jgi:hypothetical protein